MYNEEIIYLKTIDYLQSQNNKTKIENEIKSSIIEEIQYIINAKEISNDFKILLLKKML